VIAIGTVDALTRTGGDQNGPDAAGAGAVGTDRLTRSANAVWASTGAGRPSRA